MCIIYLCAAVFFFFKQKTANEMRISDWSSDVFSSDLFHARITGWREGERCEYGRRIRIPTPRVAWGLSDLREAPWPACYHEWRGHALANAAALMVPTRDQDWQALLARFAYWESLVERTLMQIGRAHV